MIIIGDPFFSELRIDARFRELLARVGPKGGFIRDIARMPHYDGSGDRPLWIQIAGIGPTGSINVDPPK
jgi:hypothetical protein